MQEHIVQHHVQVGTGGLGAVAGIGAGPGGRVEAQVGAIGGEGGARRGQGSQPREGSAHEAQVHQKAVAHQVERIEGQRLHLAFVHRAPLLSLSRTAPGSSCKESTLDFSGQKGLE